MAYKSGEPSWNWRRYVIFGVISFGLWLTYSMRNADDTMINRSIVEGAFMMVMAFGLGYTGLATVQDIAAIWRTRSGLPYRPQEEEEQK